MTKEFKLALEALARAGGLTVEYGCTYCQERSHNPDGHERHEIVTFIEALPEEEEEEEEDDDDECVCPLGHKDCEICS